MDILFLLEPFLLKNKTADRFKLWSHNEDYFLLTWLPLLILLQLDYLCDASWLIPNDVSDLFDESLIKEHRFGSCNL
jgi:hypothetical protein